MKCNAVHVMLGIFIATLLVIAGCGGGGGGAGGSAGGSISNSSTTTNLITSVGWVYDNAAPDYTNNGSTCLLRVYVQYDQSIAAADIDSIGVTAQNGWGWTIPAANCQLSTGIDGKPYISSSIYYGANPNAMPLAGTWSFQLKLKNGQMSTTQKSFHEPGSTADATHQYVYAAEDWTPLSDPLQYIALLGRFQEQGYTLQNSVANGGSITTTGLAATRTKFLTAQPHAYNMNCWLYDANKTYLGNTITEFIPQDHSRTNLIDANGELSIVPASTVSATGQMVDLSVVKYLRFVYYDGAQFGPSTYLKMDNRSISSLVPVLASINTIPGTTSPWVSKVSRTTSQLKAVVYGGGQFVAVGAPATILTSPGGTTWTLQASGVLSGINGICYAAGQYLAVGSNGTILKSPDGITWSNSASATVNQLTNVTYGSGQYVVVGDNGTIESSSDGISWTLRTSGTTHNLAGIAYGGNQFIAVGGGATNLNTTVILSSPDGITWTNITPAFLSNPGYSLSGIVYDGSYFVAVSNSSNSCFVSPDGINWTQLAINQASGMFGITYNGSRLVAVGINTMSSPDRVNWEVGESGTAKWLYSVAYGAGVFVAVGQDGTILTKTF